VKSSSNPGFAAERHSPVEASVSFYDFTASLIDALIYEFNLRNDAGIIESAYQLVCRESLALPYGLSSLNFSRINLDGTPIQFSTCFGNFSSPLQFLSQIGSSVSTNKERQTLTKKRFSALARLFGVESVLEGVAELLDELAFGRHSELLAESAGAAWIGVSFSPAGESKLKIYLNGRWGTERDRWVRQRRLAEHFGAQKQWREMERLTIDEMEPLGTSLVFERDRPLAGRLYLRSFGKPLLFYEHLAGVSGSEALAESLGDFSKTILREESQSPTQSVVCSFGCERGRCSDFKVEMCAHRAFRSDLEIRDRFLDWLRHERVSEEAYLNMLEILAAGGPSKEDVQLHSFVGLGQKGKTTYSTCYFKPAPPGNFT
jgi:hypothetical protein